MDTETQNAQKSARAMPENWPNIIERIRYVFYYELYFFTKIILVLQKYR